MTLWLLDTDTLSDMVKHGRGRVRKRIDAVGINTTCTSIVVACEMRYGAQKRGNARLTERIVAMLDNFDIRPLGEDADHQYARLRCDLERKGTPIGQNDMLIAAHALALGATLVTANVREFARIEGLRLENWLEA